MPTNCESSPMHVGTLWDIGGPHPEERQKKSPDTDGRMNTRNDNDMEPKDRIQGPTQSEAGKILASTRCVTEDIDDDIRRTVCA